MGTKGDTLEKDELGEFLEVKLPKGPAAYCTERINGRPPRNCYHINKSYQVTIEADGCKKLVRRRKIPEHKFEELPPEEVAAAAGLPTTAAEITGDDLELPKGDAVHRIADAMQKCEGYYARSRFRQRRAPAFEKAKRFPALANHRLVPEWKEQQVHYSDEDDKKPKLSARQRTQQRLVAPTLAGAIRQQVKRPPSPGAETQWLTAMDANTFKRECARTPMFCNEPFVDPTDNIGRSESTESKRQWITETFFKCGPRVPSLSEAKMALARRNLQPPREDFKADPMLEDIHNIREKGAENNMRLQCRYEMKLEAFKDEQDRRGPMSNFARRELRCAQELFNTPVVEEAPKPVREEVPGFSGLGIGFGRYKANNLSIEG